MQKIKVVEFYKTKFRLYKTNLDVPAIKAVILGTTTSSAELVALTGRIFGGTFSV